MGQRQTEAGFDYNNVISGAFAFVCLLNFVSSKHKNGFKTENFTDTEVKFDLVEAASCLHDIL